MSLADIDRRTLLSAMGATLTLGAAKPTWAQEDAVTFLALGDWGQGGSPTQRRVADAMGATALEIGGRFVISAGDNFYPSGVTSTRDTHWRRSFEDVYTAPALQIPWFSALGNHDYRGDVRAQVAYTRQSTRWRMPSRYFKVEGADFGAPFVDLFIIDTSPMVDGRNYDELFQQLTHGRRPRQNRKRQLAWLDHALASSQARWKIVVGHHPVFSGGHGDSAELIERLLPLLERHGVQLYVNGHDHSLQHIRRGEIDFVCTGSGAEANDTLRVIEGTRHASSKPGFAAFKVSPTAIAFEFRDHHGERVYRADRAGPAATI